MNGEKGGKVGGFLLSALEVVSLAETAGAVPFLQQYGPCTCRLPDQAFILASSLLLFRVSCSGKRREACLRLSRMLLAF